jgi:hypothetical protein
LNWLIKDKIDIGAKNVIEKNKFLSISQCHSRYIPEEEDFSTQKYRSGVLNGLTKDAPLSLDSLVSIHHIEASIRENVQCEPCVAAAVRPLGES